MFSRVLFAVLKHMYLRCSGALHKTLIITTDRAKSDLNPNKSIVYYRVFFAVLKHRKTSSTRALHTNHGKTRAFCSKSLPESRIVSRFTVFQACCQTTNIYGALEPTQNIDKTHTICSNLHNIWLKCRVFSWFMGAAKTLLFTVVERPAWQNVYLSLFA